MMKPTKLKTKVKLGVLSAILAVAALLCGMVVVGMYRTGSEGRNGDELFVDVDYYKLINESIQLPFVHEMRGEYSIVRIVLDRIDRVYPYDNRIFVVLEGSAGIYGIENGKLQETSTAALRFSWEPYCSDSALVLAEEPVLGKLSVYSSSKDVEAILERRGGACWNAFCASISSWKMPLLSMPFIPARRIQLEEDGVFVFEEKP